MDWASDIISVNQRIQIPLGKDKTLEISVKREDEIHPQISGNKWRKLKYNMLKAMSQGKKGLLTFGGAYSNHILASAAAAKSVEMKSLGIIRGDQVSNPTLKDATEYGMELKFVDRQSYRNEKAALLHRFDPESEYYHVPEGGANEEGVAGCEEILTDRDRSEFDIICCSAGTGGTAAGILRSLGDEQQLWVYPALKGDFMENEISKWIDTSVSDKLKMRYDYSFGGYAKTSPKLFDFLRGVYDATDLKLDPIYTGKMCFGIREDVSSGLIPEGSRVLMIHTGGLQGIRGIEERHGQRLFPKGASWSDN